MSSFGGSGPPRPTTVPPDLDRIVTDEALLDPTTVRDRSLVFGVRRARVTSAEAWLLERFFAERGLFGF